MAQERQHFSLCEAIWNVQVTKGNGHDIKMSQNNEWQLQNFFLV